MQTDGVEEGAGGRVESGREWEGGATILDISTVHTFGWTLKFSRCRGALCTGKQGHYCCINTCMVRWLAV